MVPMSILPDLKKISNRFQNCQNCQLFSILFYPVCTGTIQNLLSMLIMKDINQFLDADKDQILKPQTITFAKKKAFNTMAHIYVNWVAHRW